MSEKTTAAATPANRPSHTLPVNVAAAAEANAPTRILPSSPMSTMPERSDQRPAKEARMSGTARRMPEAKTTTKALNHSMLARLSDGRLCRPPREQSRDRAAEHVLERAGEQHDQALDHDNHVAADLGHIDREGLAALIEDAEQDRGEDDAHGMRAPHESNRNADEAEPANEFEDQAMLVAQDDVGRNTAGKSARQQRGDDGDTGRGDAAVNSCSRIGADGANLIAEPGAPDEEPDCEAAEQRKQEGQIERRHRPCDSEMGEHFVELRHERRIAEGRRLGVHLPGLAQNVHEQVAHDGR